MGYINGFYNGRRIQERLGFLSPIEFEEKYYAKQATGEPETPSTLVGQLVRHGRRPLVLVGHRVRQSPQDRQPGGFDEGAEGVPVRMLTKASASKPRPTAASTVVSRNVHHAGRHPA
ncbi:hypothetical protein [Streptomyces sp. NPDC048385]|uniref:hypothetical protein n=1 Tax=unclassified Streptomyces TaxID=2593676 RepID=UPI00343EE848